MRPLLIAALAVAGLAIGWGQRAVVLRYAIPAGGPPRFSPDGENPVLAVEDPARDDEDPAPAVGNPAPDDEDQAPPGGHLAAPPAATGREPGRPARTGPPSLALGLTTAVLLGALASRVHPGLVLAAACWLAICCIPLAWIDVAVCRLPDALTGPAYAGTIAVLLAAAVASGHWHLLIRAVLGGLALTGCYLALAVISHSALGLGDVKLAASLGSLLAWFSWNMLLDGAFAGFLLAAVYGIALLIGHRATRKQQIPFGPFMIAGTFAVILILAGTGAGSG
jgi:leader peptidase (prepilin peptidase) / N-methyltransferase